jgi:hypothetical protein
VHSRVHGWGKDVLYYDAAKRSLDYEWLHSFPRVNFIFNHLCSGLFKEIHRKVPSIVCMPKNKIDLRSCNFKGDTSNDAFTTGVLILKSDALINECQFAHHKSGAIMMDIEP